MRPRGALACMVLAALASCASHPVPQGSTPQHPLPSATETAQQNGPATATKVQDYEPWTATGQLEPGLEVTQRTEGFCWIDSITNGTNTWRCFQGNAIRDPCYSQSTEATPTQVACPVPGPWSRTVIILALTKPLPKGNTGVSSSEYTWVELANGEHCSRASAELGKVLITMDCDGPWKYVSTIDQDSPTWIAHLLKGPWRHFTRTAMPVVEAWR